MAHDPGEWYAVKAAEATRLEREIAAAKQETPPDQAKIRRLERQLEHARYVGD